jgi:hypothetical protein
VHHSHIADFYKGDGDLTCPSKANPVHTDRLSSHTSLRPTDCLRVQTGKVPQNRRHDHSRRWPKRVLCILQLLQLVQCTYVVLQCKLKLGVALPLYTHKHTHTAAPSVGAQLARLRLGAQVWLVMTHVQRAPATRGAVPCFRSTLVLLYCCSTIPRERARFIERAIPIQLL